MSSESTQAVPVKKKIYLFRKYWRSPLSKRRIYVLRKYWAAPVKEKNLCPQKMLKYCQGEKSMFSENTGAAPVKKKNLCPPKVLGSPCQVEGDMSSKKNNLFPQKVLEQPLTSKCTGLVQMRAFSLF